MTISETVAVLAMVLGIVSTGCVAAIDSTSDAQAMAVYNPAPTCSTTDFTKFAILPCNNSLVDTYDSHGSLCATCYDGVTVPDAGGCAVREKATGLPYEVLCVSTQAQCDSDCHPKP